ncbi:MAG: hypothetical protein IKY03_02855 [Clostridia bacterium]|nr:hypothetical protein [Clostridia bacterium]
MRKMKAVVAVLTAACILLSGFAALAETTPSATPVPSGNEVEGTVLSVGENDIMIKMENGNVFNFIMDNISDTIAQVGDEVIIGYEGDILKYPQATSITVTKVNPVATVSGKVLQHDATTLFLEISSTEALGFWITKDTAVTGLSDVIMVGDTVTVTYEGDVLEGATAKQIEITAMENAARANDVKEPENTENKTLNGEVVQLTSKMIKIKTSSSHSYSFKITKSTSINKKKGKLEVGCRVRVTYDGYASKSPNAKEIKVTKPYEPTPTKKPVVLKTVTGTVTSFGGMWLELKNGYGFDVTYAKYAGNGHRVPGERAKVTYYTKGGINYAVKVVFSIPVNKLPTHKKP